MNTAVDNIWQEYKSVCDLFARLGEMSAMVDYTNTMRKVIILSCGSYFEYEMTKMLKDYVLEASNGNVQIASFLERQAIRQKYHTLFDWGKQDDPSRPSTSANNFFKLFGDEFRMEVDAIIKAQPEIKESQNAFLELGHLRNILVHSNFADYAYSEKTPEDIYALYKKACQFIPFISEKLREQPAAVAK